VVLQQAHVAPRQGRCVGAARAPARREPRRRAANLAVEHQKGFTASMRGEESRVACSLPPSRRAAAHASLSPPLPSSPPPRRSLPRARSAGLTYHDAIAETGVYATAISRLPPDMQEARQVRPLFVVVYLASLGPRRPSTYAAGTRSFAQPTFLHGLLAMFIHPIVGAARRIAAAAAPLAPRLAESPAELLRSPVTRRHRLAAAPLARPAARDQGLVGIDFVSAMRGLPFRDRGPAPSTLI
jgi:hypothetical protein